MASLEGRRPKRVRVKLRWRRLRRSFWFVTFSLLAVVSSILPAIGGSPKPTAVMSSIFFAVAGAFAITLWPERRRERLVWVSLEIFGAAVLLRALPFDIAAAVSDALITLAMVLLVAYLCAGAILSVPVRLEKLRHWWPHIVERANRISEAREASLPRVAIIVALAIGLFFSLPRPGAQTWSLLGSSTGSPVWNAHVISSNLVVSSHGLLDSLIVSGRGRASPVAIPDAPILDALKFLHPGALNGPFIVNFVALIGLFGLLVAGVLFVDNFCANRYAGAGALLLFATLPLSFSARFAAPLDLIVPVALCAYIIARPGQQVLAAVIAFLAGFTNVASGYELAVMLIALRVAGYGPGSFTWLLAALAALGSVVFAGAVQGLAPTVSLTQNWWFADQLSRIFWTEHLTIAPGWVILAALLVAFGIKQMIADRARRPLTFAATLAGLGLVLAVPTHLGGVPIVSAAKILQILPLGWPSARMLELALFALTIPIAFSFRSVIGFVAATKPELLRVAPWIAVFWVSWLLHPKPVAIAIPNESPNTTLVEFPIAEGGSPAGISYADELLARGLRIVQPLVYVEGSPLSTTDQIGAGPTDHTMHKLGVRVAVVRGDLYANPRLRTVEPQLYDAKASEVPQLTRNANYKLAQFAEETDVYWVNPR